ncbi:hypothetical protein [Deinococcus hopiensis]|nr:hypothetical protein [Deinococcus hopiensis]
MRIQVRSPGPVKKKSALGHTREDMGGAALVLIFTAVAARSCGQHDGHALRGARLGAADGRPSSSSQAPLAAEARSTPS